LDIEDEKNMFQQEWRGDDPNAGGDMRFMAREAKEGGRDGEGKLH
jgi:hypothetical protein